MIKSMTGYGRARETRNSRDITVEVRAVNNRYLDCTVKMPRLYIFAEDALKQRVQKAVSRGKVDVFVTVDASAADVTQVTVNRELASQYAVALNELAEVCGPVAYKVTPEVLARFPDVLSVTKADEDLETVSADLCAVLDQALEAFNEMRGVEGAKLAEDIGNRLTAIEAYTGQVEARSPETVAEYRAKLTARMQEALQSVTIDPQRILTEAAIYADKVAVDEETVRLRSHVAQLRTMLEATGDVRPGRGRGPQAGLPHSGGQPGIQHHRLQVRRRGHRPGGGEPKGRGGEDAGTGAERGVSMEFIDIGFGSMVSRERVVAIVGPDSAPIRRMTQESRERGMLIDATYGRKTASIFIMDSDHVILSALPTERFGGEKQEEA